MPTGQFSRPQSMSQASLSRATSGSPSAASASHRQSMPPQRVSSASPPTHGRPRFEPMPEEQEETDPEGTVVSRSARHVRKGTMTKNFKFPPPAQTSPPPVPPVPAEPAPTPTSPPSSRPQKQQEASPRPEGGHHAEAAQSPVPPSAGRRSSTEEAKLSPVPLITPSVVEVPPPPPVDKEVAQSIPEGDDDLGETEEISLN